LASHVATVDQTLSKAKAIIATSCKNINISCEQNIKQWQRRTMVATAGHRGHPKVV